MSKRSKMKRNTQFFDLFWEDIIVAHILPRVSIEDCFNFRCASKTCLQIIKMYFATLKSLKLRNRQFSSETFKVFTLSCTKLTELELTGSSVTDDQLIPLLLQNRNLVSLELSICCHVSSKCLQPVILYCNNLQKLDLGRNLWVTTGAMEALALHQSRLEEVDLGLCPMISESCILILIKKFHNLRVFSLRGNKQVTDRTLFTLAKHSKKLKLLNLEGCSEITDLGITAIGHHCASLEGLLIRGCLQVTECSLRPLRGNLRLDRRIPHYGPQVPIYLQV